MFNEYKQRDYNTLYPISDLCEEDGLVLLWKGDAPFNPNEQEETETPVLGWGGDSSLKDDEEGGFKFFTAIPPINFIEHNGVKMSYEWYLIEVLKVKQWKNSQI